MTDEPPRRNWCAYRGLLMPYSAPENEPSTAAPGPVSPRPVSVDEPVIARAALFGIDRKPCGRERLDVAVDGAP